MRPAKMSRLLWLLAVGVVGACVLSDGPLNPPRNRHEPPSGFATTYEKLLPIAEAGDPEVQNMLGFMFFHGEGVARDYDEAHIWFHRAGEEGNVNAAWNLGILHSGVLPEVPENYHDSEEANFWIDLATSRDVQRITYGGEGVSASGSMMRLPADAALMKGEEDIGTKVYRTFCAGCHGFDGMAVYPGAPSFALGERLDVSDSELARHVAEGVGEMSGWAETLSPELMAYTVAAIRANFGASAPHREAPRTLSARSASLDTQGRGERSYMTFCAGCHGFNGIAYYVHSPSFAVGERLEKTDFELEKSVGRGIGSMPGWEAMLSAREIRDVVSFVRTLRLRYEDGVSGELQDAPPLYFRFRRDAELGGRDTSGR